MEYYAAVRKNEILPLAATWVDMEGIMLSEISQRKTNTVYYLYVESKKYNKLTKEAGSQINREKLVVTSGESERGWSKIGAENEQAQTITYKISHKAILCNREYSQYSVTTTNGVYALKLWVTTLYICNLYNTVWQPYFKWKIEVPYWKQISSPVN